MIDGGVEIARSQYYNVVLYNNAQTYREDTTRQRYTAERCEFKLGDCMKVVKACAEELGGKIEGEKRRIRMQ